MRLNLSLNKTMKGGAKPIESNVHKTTLNNTIFRIVTQGLYIRPIEAIVREICTNALDGHIKAGKADVPFEIRLPTMLDPYFIVRDFGCSMDNDTMFNIYGVLGESTKNQGADEIGGWGVGGKSPAAYTDTFFITTYLNGRRKIYQSSCLPESSPLELMLDGEFDAPDGVEVKIPVREKDFERFIKAVRTQIAPFDVKPIIKNYPHGDFLYAFDLNPEKADTIESVLTLPNREGELVKTPIDVTTYPDVLDNTLAVRMGCVIYPINSTAECYNEFVDKINEISNISGIDNLLFDLPVDAVDIKPSREDLDYTDRTNAILNELMRNCYKHYRRKVTKVAWELRKLQPYDALSKLYEDNPEAMADYIAKKYKRLCPIEGKFAVYAKLLNTWYTTLMKKIDELDLSRKDANYYEAIKICDGYEATRWGKHTAKLAPIGDKTVTVLRKSNGYIRKTEYARDNDLLPDSGLYFYLASRHYYYHYHTSIPKNSINAWMTMTDEQIAIYEPVFAEMGITVNVFDLPDIPASEKERYRSDRTYYKTQTKIPIRAILADGTSELKEIDANYSFKQLNEAIEEMQQELAFNTAHHDYEVLIADKDATWAGNDGEFRDLVKYHNKNYFIVHLTPAFYDKVRDKLGYLSYQTATKNMMDAVHPSDAKLMVEALLQGAWERELKEGLYGFGNRRNFACTLLDEPNARKYFFGFLPPKKTERKLKYPSLAHSLEKEMDTSDFFEGVPELSKRVVQRVKWLCNHYRTLSLIDSNSTKALIMELLSLNFKGFNYDKESGETSCERKAQ